MSDNRDLVSVSLKLPESGKQMIDQEANRRYMSQSNFLRLVILRGLQEELDEDVSDEAIVV